MDNVIGLNKIRKKRQRAQKEAQAQANRLLHGQSKRTREQSERIRDAASRRLEAHRRDEIASEKQEDRQ